MFSTQHHCPQGMLLGLGPLDYLDTIHAQSTVNLVIPQMQVICTVWLPDTTLGTTHVYSSKIGQPLPESEGFHCI
jgi:hypothetical protein